MNKIIMAVIVVAGLLVVFGGFYLTSNNETPTLQEPFEFIDCSTIPYLPQVSESPSKKAAIERYEHPDLSKDKLFVNITLYERISGKYKSIFYLQKSTVSNKFGKVTFGDFFELDEPLPSSKVTELAHDLEENQTARFDFYLTETPFNPERPEEYIKSLCIKKNPGQQNP